MEAEVAEAGWTAVLCRYWDSTLEESLLTFVFVAIGACLIFLIYFGGVRSEPRLCSQRERWASMSAGRGKENKAFSLRELSDRHQYSCQHGCETIGPGLPSASAVAIGWFGPNITCG